MEVPLKDNTLKTEVFRIWNRKSDSEQSVYGERGRTKGDLPSLFKLISLSK